MTRLVHLSDLHFGRAYEELQDPLLRTIDTLAPDLVIVSGDLSHRARSTQLKRACAFLKRLSAPWLAVPGNHDVPLDNPVLRIAAPLLRYRGLIQRETAPVFRDDAVVVAGINSVDPRAWQRGRLSARRTMRACSAFAGAGARMRVAVMHHPLEHGPDEHRKLAQGAPEALERLARSGAEIVLSGHRHDAVSGPFHAAPGILMVQAATALCNRNPDAPNGFNLLDLKPGEVTLGGWVASDTGAFEPVGRVTYLRGPQGWALRGQSPSTSTVRLPLV